MAASSMTDASKPFRDYVRQLAEFSKKFLNMNPYIFSTPPPTLL